MEYTIPAELLKRYEVELEELKNLHASIQQGDPEVLRECIEKCEVLGIKVVELLEVASHFDPFKSIQRPRKR